MRPTESQKLRLAEAQSRSDVFTATKVDQAAKPPGSDAYSLALAVQMARKALDCAVIFNRRQLRLVP